MEFIWVDPNLSFSHSPIHPPSTSHPFTSLCIPFFGIERIFSLGLIHFSLLIHLRLTLLCECSIYVCTREFDKYNFISPFLTHKFVFWLIHSFIHSGSSRSGGKKRRKKFPIYGFKTNPQHLQYKYIHIHIYLYMSRKKGLISIYSST